MRNTTTILLLVLPFLLGCARVDTTTGLDLGTDTSVPDTTDTGGETPPDTPTDGCPDGYTDCSGSCVDLQTDPLNCGYCGNDCPEPYINTVGVCIGATCGFECAVGWVDLDGVPGCETACSGSGTEICNGIDDDCDTIVDDGFDCTLGAIVECVTTCSTFGSGTCTATCEIPAPADCVPPAEE